MSHNDQVQLNSMLDYLNHFSPAKCDSDPTLLPLLQRVKDTLIAKLSYLDDCLVTTEATELDK